MPRKLRIEYPGAMYHVTSRGNRRQDIFLDDVDRHDFLKTLAEACQKTGWQVHAYCLMEARRLEPGDEVALQVFRRGWHVGSEAFRQEQLACMEGKLAIAVRLRRKTTLSIKTITARVFMGTSNTANARLHRAMKELVTAGSGQGAKTKEYMGCYFVDDFGFRCVLARDEAIRQGMDEPRVLKPAATNQP